MRRRIQGVVGMVMLAVLACAAAGAQSQPATRQLPPIAPKCTNAGLPNGEKIPVYCKASPAPAEIAHPLTTDPPAKPNANSDAKSSAQQAPANPPAVASPDAPAPTPAQLFPFPEEDSKTKSLTGAHPVPQAPTPDAPAANDAGKQFPYPGSDAGDTAPAPDGGGYSSSGDNAPGNPAAGSLPDAPLRKKLQLEDAGSAGRVDTARADKDQQVADFYIKDGNYAGAYLRYKDAVTFDPDNADAHFGLAAMARKKGKTDEAIAEYGAALKLDPQGRHAKEARKALAELQAAAKK